ncbi:MAG: hypothetical protein HZC14_03805 [Candidatus Niyogibacteria bacterium]|nr:hypothetical protein [Candidatus Niyogibacteria bacterium]
MKSANPVRATTFEVVRRAKYVKINRRKIKELARLWARDALIGKLQWPVDTHYASHNSKKLLDYIVLLDTLNFGFWSRDDKKSWNIFYRGKRYGRYFAWAMSLKKFFENDLDAGLDRFERITFNEFKNIFHGRGELLFLKKRWQMARQVARAIRMKYGDAGNMVMSCDQKFSWLVPKIAALPSFDDVAMYGGKKVYIWKRAQILALDIWGAFQGRGLGKFKDLDYVTTFADYRIPQILREYGVLEYSPVLEKKILNKHLIRSGSAHEVEIRAATIWAVEYLTQELHNNGVRVHLFQVDWFLWETSKKIKIQMPHHLTKTVFY